VPSAFRISFPIGLSHRDERSHYLPLCDSLSFIKAEYDDTTFRAVGLDIYLVMMSGPLRRPDISQANRLAKVNIKTGLCTRRSVEVRRFVVLSTQHSGTSRLTQSLYSHPQIYMVHKPLRRAKRKE